MAKSAVLLSGLLAVSGRDARWQHVADAPWSTRGHFGVALTDNGTMLVAGGMHTADNTHLNDVWSSTDGETWKQLTQAAPWADRHRHGMVFLNGCSYIFGGTTIRNGSAGRVQFNFNDVWKSCDEGQSWSCVTEHAQWSPREGFGFTVVDGKILLVGGTVEDVGGAVNEVWASQDGQDWKLLSSNATTENIWAPRYAVSAITTPQGEVIVAGGFGARTGGGISGMGGFADVWASNDGGHTWEKRTAKAPFGRRVYTSLAVSGASTYLIGGQAGVGQLFRSFHDVWVTEDGAKWRRAARMPRGMKARGSVGVLPHSDGNDGMILLGGSSEIFPHKDFSDVWRFTPEASVLV